MQKLPRLRQKHNDAAGMMLKIARIQKSNGTEGEVVINFHGISPDEIDIKEPVFIYFDGLPVPFFFDSFAKKGNTKALAHLTGIDSIADADEIAGKYVYSADENLETELEDDFSFLEGWTLTDACGNIKGTITGFLDIPNNPCLEVSVSPDKKADIMVPLHDDLITGMDETSRILSMQIPDGLF